MKHSILALLFCVAALLGGAEDPAVRQEAQAASSAGMAAMASADGNGAKLIEAARAFAKAQQLYEKRLYSEISGH
jgi:hypothetical protein